MTLPTDAELMLWAVVEGGYTAKPQQHYKERLWFWYPPKAVASAAMSEALTMPSKLREGMLREWENRR